MNLKVFVSTIEALREALRATPDLHATATIALTTEEFHELLLSQDESGHWYFPVTTAPDGSRRCPGGLRFDPVDDDHWIVTVERGLRGLDYI